MTAGERLRKWRGDRPQQEIADALGVNQTTVAKLEVGQHTPRLPLALAIGELTGGEVPPWAWVPGRKTKRSAKAAA